jgi:gas vesicle protein
MEKFTPTFEEFMNETKAVNEDEQADLNRVLKVMKTNRDDFKRALKKNKEDYSPAEIKDLEARIEQLNFLINANTEYLRDSKVNKDHGDRKPW